MDFSEKWGKDVEDAVRLALTDLGLKRDQVEVIVLEEPSRGFLGFGSKLAKVRVQPISKQETPDEKNNKKAKQEKNIRNTKREPKKSQSEKKKTDEGSEVDQRNDRKKETGIRIRPDNLKPIDNAPALGFLREVISCMGLDLAVVASENDECLYFDITGKDSGTIIGKRGQTLDSIQYLTSLVVGRESEKYSRVVVDAENYRQKREKTLEQLAIRLGEKVKKTGKSVRLEPMNPYERKVIHSTLQRNPQVMTRSEGDEPYRRVIIEQK
jgi:spoIIIJ-associated protein